MTARTEMQDYELLGAFYLGRQQEADNGGTDGELLLYDSRDLTTHAVIIGMTGSGKTGLGIGLIEEAGMDHVPVIAVDPKGDLGNLLLTFPDLAPRDLEPWVDPAVAAARGKSVGELAADQAELWRKGLAEWGMDGDRIRRFRDSVELGLYTPGSSAATPIAVLGSLAAPGPAVLDDTDLYRDSLQATVTGLFTLAGIDADPVTSREHILVSRVLDAAWREGRNLTLADLIGGIQQPAFDKVGVLDLESFFPARDRFTLAMRLNNLLSAPGFEAWMMGVPLDAGRLLYTDSGKPRISIVSIAHLSDTERMFFVCMLLTELIRWMRQQPGTGSLRAILYFDELFGYMPPVANPPSKPLLLTLLKQARAYGLGVVVATQNPVDLDYKGLSNAGTWFIGRLQTERDKARVMDGLQGASAQGFNRAEMERTISGLGQRRFLLHSVHTQGPVVFTTRWVMSYLAGPMTRDQLRRLADGSGARSTAAETQPPSTNTPVPALAVAESSEASGSNPPLVPPGVPLLYMPDANATTLFPSVIGVADMVYSQVKVGVDERRRLVLIAAPPEGPIADVDWSSAREAGFETEALADRAPAGVTYAALPAALAEPKNYGAWEKALRAHLRTDRPLRLFRSPVLKLISEPGEDEGAFRARLQLAAHEKRDATVDALRKKYASRAQSLEQRRMRARQALERRSEQARTQKMNAAVSFGTALLGVVLGNKKVSSTNARSMGTAMRGGARARQQASEVGRAGETLVEVEAQIEALESELAAEVDRQQLAFDAQIETLEEISVKPRASDIQVRTVALAWLPVSADG